MTRIRILICALLASLVVGSGVVGTGQALAAHGQTVYFEAGSRLLALTGMISEQGGKRWITVTRYEPARVKYPAKMLAPDRPFASPGASFFSRVK